MRYHLYYVIRFKEGHPEEIVAGPFYDKKEARYAQTGKEISLPMCEFTLVEQTIGAELA